MVERRFLTDKSLPPLDVGPEWTLTSLSFLQNDQWKRLRSVSSKALESFLGKLDLTVRHRLSDWIELERQNLRLERERADRYRQERRKTFEISMDLCDGFTIKETYVNENKIRSFVFNLLGRFDDDVAAALFSFLIESEVNMSPMKVKIRYFVDNFKSFFDRLFPDGSPTTFYKVLCYLLNNTGIIRLKEQELFEQEVDLVGHP